MNPNARNSVEVAFYPGAPSGGDFRALAKKLAQEKSERNRLGIKPNGITRVPLKLSV